MFPSLSAIETEIDRFSDSFSVGLIVGGTLTLVVCLFFEAMWLRRDKPVPLHYKEVAPVWAYEANAWIAGIWTPVGLVYGVWDSWLAGADMWDVINMKTGFDVFVFGALFGIMLKDFLLFYKTPDLILLAHHLVVMTISVVLCFFTPIHAVRLCTLCALITEMGSACYCIYIAYQQITLYKYGMTISNAFFVTAIYLWCASNLQTYPELSQMAAVPTASLAIGRQVILHMEIRREQRLSALKKID